MSLLLALSLVTTSSLAQSPPSRREAEVRVHIDTDSPDVSLFRVTSETYGAVATGSGTAMLGLVQFQRECQAPCDTHILQPQSDFFIGGNGITPSARFSLLDQGRDISLRVQAGSSGLRYAGWVSTLLGVTFAALGGVILAIESAVDESTLRDTNSGPLRKGALGSLIGGGALFAIGVPLIVFNGTDVEFVANKQPDAGRGPLDL